MRITSIQLEMRDRPKEENVEHALHMVDQAPQSHLILLPEIWPCGYFSFDRYQSESEPMNGPTVKAFQQKAIERQCHILMGSIVEKDDQNLFNTNILLDPQGQIIARYRKIHLFGYQSEEKEILTPGSEIIVEDTPWGPAGLSTCYDLRFPEFFRKMLDRGAKLFLVSSAWPYARLEAWVLFNRARALENLSFLFSCNCVGSNRGNRYAGHSMIVDPLGRVIGEGGEDEGYVSADVDTHLVDSVRAEFSALDDRVFH